jgi:hypothetical protein
LENEKPQAVLHLARGDYAERCNQEQATGKRI